ncbi:hypothetical protein [Actinoplanes sp. NPDC051494]|uniref:hypothetical protein n=1 Tax=Actinoplanes sp. NPDC051494 TaxID=3363907 RepID=UPI0037A21963
MTAPVHLPAPPQGPGVYPPFPAPPVEGRRRRRGLAIGIGAGALVLAIVGGLAAVIGLGTVMTRALSEQVEATIDDYYGALLDRRYGEAYDMQCEQQRRDRTQAEFTAGVTGEEPVVRWDMVSFSLQTGTAAVDRWYSGGPARQVTVNLDQNTSTGSFELCGFTE